MTASTIARPTHSKAPRAGARTLAAWPAVSANQAPSVSTVCALRRAEAREQVRVREAIAPACAVDRFRFVSPSGRTASAMSRRRTTSAAIAIGRAAADLAPRAPLHLHAATSEMRAEAEAAARRPTVTHPPGSSASRTRTAAILFPRIPMGRSARPILRPTAAAWRARNALRLVPPARP